MTVYDYMCDVLHIEACTDCANFKNWECKEGFDHGDANCLACFGVTMEDVARGTHPAESLRKQFAAAQEEIKRMQEKYNRK